MRVPDDRDVRGLRTRGNIVLDVLMLVLLAVAFGGAVGYVWACVDLTRTNGAAGGTAE
jgi:nitrate reductase NapE component